MSKAEIGLFAAGSLTALGAIVLRKFGKIERDTMINALIFAGGTLATGGAMTAYRKLGVERRGLLGLSTGERVSNGAGTLQVWDDPEMTIKQRVYLLQGQVAKSVKDPEVRKLALGITGHGITTVKIGNRTITVRGAGCPARDDMCELKAIFDFAANPENVRYTGDVGAHTLWPGGPVEPVDQYQSAARTLEYKGGDCDDSDILNAALVIQNGFAAKFRITSNEGDSWDHIYLMAGVPKLNPTRWVALDTTLGPGNFDRQPARKKQIDFAA